jgi:hypothetical protein
MKRLIRTLTAGTFANELSDYIEFKRVLLFVIKTVRVYDKRNVINARVTNFLRGVEGRLKQWSSNVSQ